MEIELPKPDRVRRSRHISVFAQLGDVFVYHDLYGFILKMSPDVLEFLEAFGDGAEIAGVCDQFAGRFEGANPAQFVDVFWEFCCLVAPEADERAGIWRRYPVKSKWNVWHRADDGRLRIISAWGDRPVSSLELSAAESAVWDALDPNKDLGSLAEAHERDVIAGLVVKLVHNDVQALKLSHFPLSFYKGRTDLQPPYLTSTMPYARHRPAGADTPLAQQAAVSPRHYYEHDIADADEQFDHQETTLSHLLRVPHAALGGRTYGQAVIDALGQRGGLPAGRARVLEIGGGLGFFARAVVESLQGRELAVDYTIVELSPALAAKQRERCAGLPVQVIERDVLEAELEAGSYDLIFANEMVGDLEAVKLTRGQLETLRAGSEVPAELTLAGRLIRDYELPLDDAPDEFYLLTGALQLVEKLASALAPGGTGFITEFGERSQYPRLSTHLDHPELSIHFGWLEHLARRLSMTSELVFVMDLIELDRSLEGLATTRSYFRALAALLAEHGITLQKIGYTRPMFDELLAGKLDPATFGEVYFDKIEDRLMGLVPHEFKALILKR